MPTSIRLSNQLSRDPNKHVRPKAFPYGQLPPSQTSMASLSAVDMSRQGTPLPKGPPAAYMPAPPEVTSMSTSAQAAVPEPYVTENGKYRTIRSVADIDWSRPLYEHLEPNLKGGPRSSRTSADLSTLRAKIPKLTKQLFDGLFPADNTITAVQKSHGVHKIHMSCSMGPQCNTLVQPLTAAHDGRCVVSQLGRCKQVPVLDADTIGPL